MRFPLVTVAALLFAVLLAPSARGLTIDNFEEGDFLVTDPGSPAAATSAEQSGLLTSNVLGGVRLVRATAGGGTAANVATAALTTTGLDDSVLLSHVGVNTDSTFVFIYDGVAGGTANNSAGTLNLDLSAALSIDITATAPVGGAHARVILWTSTTSQGTAFDPLVNGVTSFPLSTFGLLNLADIRQIQVTISDVSAANAVAVTHIEAVGGVVVPEPSTGLLVGLGLFGLAVGRRRSEV
ncbi:MAG: PEP-CTERM sorting domain-containing protein [Deltaproteobacteria bacterium]|nr:MAG: PEP-CTERM sorting domain-containing protein [Deltaproteobacteria bacterium]